MSKVWANGLVITGAMRPLPLYCGAPDAHDSDRWPRHQRAYDSLRIPGRHFAPRNLPRYAEISSICRSVSSGFGIA